MSLSIKPKVHQQSFIILPYIVLPDRRLCPEKPLLCVHSKADVKDCKISIKRWRARLHGPGFPLVSMACRVHGISFTVYPPGWLPYSRSPIMHVDHMGRLPSSVVESSQNSWDFTLFKGLFDISKKNKWPEELNLGPGNFARALGPCRRTQRRHCKGALTLLGLMNTSFSSSISTLTGTPQAEFESLAKKIREGPRSQSVWVGGAEIVKNFKNTSHTYNTLYTLGMHQKFWGKLISQ